MADVVVLTGDQFDAIIETIATLKSSVDEMRNTVEKGLDSMMTKAQAAAFLNKSVRHLDTITNAGNIPVHIIGGKKYYRKSELLNHKTATR